VTDGGEAVEPVVGSDPAIGSGPRSEAESDCAAPPKRFRRVAIFFAVVIILFLIAVALFYQSIKSGPTYSLALMTEAARVGNADEVNRFVDIDAVIDDFIGQVVEEGTREGAGGIPKEVLRNLASSSDFLKPLVRERIETEIPTRLQAELGRLGNMPFQLIVLGMHAGTVVEQDGNRFLIGSRDATDDRRLVMVETKGRWTIVGFRDTALAREVALTFREEIFMIAKDGDLSGLADKLGEGGLSDLLRRMDKILNRE